MLRGSADHCAVSQHILRTRFDHHMLTPAAAANSEKTDTCASHDMLHIGAA